MDRREIYCRVQWLNNQSLKKVPKPSYGLKIVHGSPVPQFAIFRETEQFLRTLVNVQCFRIRPCHDRVVSRDLMDLPGK